MANTANTITDGVESKVRVTANIEIFDFFFVLGAAGLAYMMRGFVHEKLQIPFFLFTVLLAVFLTARSTFNKKRRNFESLYFLIMKDESVYKPIAAGEEMFWKRKSKEKKTKAEKYTLEILPIRAYDKEAGCFVQKGGQYMDLFLILSSDRSNQQGDELKYNIYLLTRFLRLYHGDLKILSMNFPVNTSFQRGVLERKKKKTTDDVRQWWLEREREELALLDQHIMRKEFYLMFFGKNREDLLKNKNNIKKWIGFGRNKLVEEMGMEKKIQIVNKINNMNTQILPDELKDESNVEETE